MTRYTLDDIKNKPSLLKFIPAEMQTPAMGLTAVSESGMALAYVGDQTPEMVRIAVTQDGLALRYVQHQTPEIALLAVQQNGLALQYVRDKTEALCLAAVQHYGLALQYVEPEVQTPALCLAAVRNTWFALSMVKLPHDNLVDPHSGQLADWLRVLRVCRKAHVKTTAQVLYPLLDNIACRPANRDEWLQVSPDGRFQLDHLVEVVKEIKRLSPRDGRIERMYHRVHQQMERCLSDACGGDQSAPVGPAFDPEATL